MPARDRPAAPKPVSPTPADVTVCQNWINRLKEVVRATGVFQTMLSLTGEGGIAHALRGLIKALDNLDGFEEACPLDVQPDIRQGRTKIRKLTSCFVRHWRWRRVIGPDGESVVQQALEDSSTTISGVRPEIPSEQFLLLGAACDDINRARAKLTLLVQQATPPLEQIAKAKQVFHPCPPSPEQAANLRRTFGVGDAPEASGGADRRTPREKRDDQRNLKALAELSGSGFPAVPRETITSRADTGNPDSPHNRASFKRLKASGSIASPPKGGTKITELGKLQAAENNE
jgi:hypothetical protein